ncbi:FecR domain-containing protein, partial [candidate division WOR-3 bacterium]|nr:FecR domain-containing protein [candidate division WOR-3 bacterium]
MVLLIIGAILNFYTNDVVIKRADSTFIPYLGMEVLDEDTVIVKDSSKAEILYSDSSKLFVDENSTLTTTSGKKRSVFLSLGRIWAKVKGLVKGESFEVSNPVSVSGVRGTEFTVSYKDDEAEVKVLSGKVNIRELATGSAVLLEREGMAQVKRGMAIEVRKFK